jgi:hypothetical protein
VSGGYVIPSAIVSVLTQLCERLPLEEVNWALTGSLGMTLSGMPLEVHDVDVQTDATSWALVEQRFATDVVEPVQHRTSGRIRSYLGLLVVEGVDVEIMGGLQKRLEDGGWEPPVDPAAHRRLVHYGSLTVPVLSLEYEAAAYERLGRAERAREIRRHLQEQSDQGAHADQHAR